MKKVFCFVLAFFMLSMSCYADVVVPEFLTASMTNYTAEYTTSFSFDNSDDLVELLKEIEDLEEAENFVDFKLLFKTLFSGEEAMKIQTDMSDDYLKIKAGITVDTSQQIAVNPNLQIGLDAKTGLWVDVDLSNQEQPVVDYIVSLPFLNKYMKIDLTKLLDSKTKLYLATMLQTDVIPVFEEECVKLFVANASMTQQGNRFTFKMDNDGLIAYINGIFNMMADKLKILDLEIPDFEGIKLLGENGLEIEVALLNGEISKVNTKTDVSLDLAEICKALTGEEWEYESLSTIDFTVATNAKFSQIGKTKVDFPVLTEENTMEFEYPEEEENTDEPYKPELPYYYVSEICDNLPVINDTVYIPLRQTIEAAYEDQAVIEYDNGVITLTSDCFKLGKEIKFTVDQNGVYTDGAYHNITNAVLIGDTTYAPSTFFTEILGWHFSIANYDLLDNEYYYTFYTDNW